MRKSLNEFPLDQTHFTPEMLLKVQSDLKGPCLLLKTTSSLNQIKKSDSNIQRQKLLKAYCNKLEQYIVGFEKNIQTLQKCKQWTELNHQQLNDLLNSSKRFTSFILPENQNITSRCQKAIAKLNHIEQKYTEENEKVFSLIRQMNLSLSSLNQFSSPKN